jgi:small subunit ribosomal protein S2
LIKITIKELLESGVHFGHRVRRWNPKMARFIFGQRNGIHIIDLQKTLRSMKEALKFIEDTVAQGGSVLFVGTKKQARDAIISQAKRCGMYFVSERWLGGTLTNFQIVRKSVERLKDIETQEKEGFLQLSSKKEAAKLAKEQVRLERLLGGIRDMDRPPGALFITDTRKERIALAEARKLDIPVVAVVDTNCDPDEVTYPIPGNDDAIKGLKLLSTKIADAVIAGSAKAQAEQDVGEEASPTAVAEEAGAEELTT